ncbi:epsin-2 isoform X1 [Parasteatoda tepidariorum]|uniref:epsin-2 isoform X1 n=1 Tax=Parasteatoda tepidariorum TaxID=114398 RepID=UPI001C723E7A|nr:epsin-2 isoform X1 [Parasteatoda tepidariorum]XP_042898561.1 epsin-2 isoform X1 [Parasteatoda tepidariorum]XP_042898562.1 epsin-2 isoform X1 [Parasteatoda tepidariorum]
MLNVQGLRRNVKNVVKNYTDAQVKVREATSNDPWGPSSTLMSEIADLTYNVVAFSEIMQMIWKRLNDHGKNWRHVYKALVLLEYLIKTGSEKVAQQCKENIFAIQTLKDFQYVEENKDQGMNVREKSRQLVGLLKDDERLKSERSRALKAKERFAQSISHSGSEAAGGCSPTGKDSTDVSPDGLPSAKGAVCTELENARPQTAGEEELQLQLALAMSKEEAEQEERLRRNDDLRLQMALNESQENYEKTDSKETNSISDLLALNASQANHTTSKQSTDPWGMPVSTDPWQSKGPVQAAESDVWGSATGGNWVPRMSTSASVSFEALGSRSDADMGEFDLLNKRSAMSSPDTTAHRSTPNPFDMADLRDSFAVNSFSNNENSSSLNNIKKTPETFLGPNSNLVNLDALVSSQGSERDLASGNPFGVPPPVSNPFQAMRPPPPTINQLRAQMQIPPLPSGIVVPPVMPTSGIPVVMPSVATFSSSPQTNNPFL